MPIPIPIIPILSRSLIRSSFFCHIIHFFTQKNHLDERLRRSKSPEASVDQRTRKRTQAKTRSFDGRVAAVTSTTTMATGRRYETSVEKKLKKRKKKEKKKEAERRTKKKRRTKESSDRTVSHWLLTRRNQLLSSVGRTRYLFNRKQWATGPTETLEASVTPIRTCSPGLRTAIFSLSAWLFSLLRADRRLNGSQRVPIRREKAGAKRLRARVERSRKFVVVSFALPIIIQRKTKKKNISLDDIKAEDLRVKSLRASVCL